MKSFIYIVNKLSNDRDGNPRRTIKVYDITNNQTYPQLVAKAEKIGYRDDQQAAIDILIRENQIPARVNQFGGNQGALCYRDQYIANICEVSYN